MGDIAPITQNDQIRRVEVILRHLAAKLANLPNLLLLFGGRRGTLAEKLVQNLDARIGHKHLAQRVQTYLPKKIEEAEIPKSDFVRYGAVIHTGEFPEQRREAMVRDADAVLLMGVGRGISEMYKLSMLYTRFVIPVPFAGGPSVEEYARLMRNPIINDELRLSLSELGSHQTTGVESAAAVATILRSFEQGRVGNSQVFLAMPFVDDFKERSAAEKVASKVCQKYGLSLYVARDTTAEKPLITEILEQIDASALLIAYLDLDRANVSLEVGYAWGKSKPVILCTKQGSSPAFDVSAHEHIRWKNLSDLRRKLSKRIEKLIAERSVIANEPL